MGKDTQPSHRVLTSCRDPGASWNILEIARSLHNDDRFSVKTLVQGPATQILKKQDIPFELINKDSTTKTSDSNFLALKADVKSRVEQYNPDSILTGLSNPDLGVDEALVSLADDLGIPSFTFQDYWGGDNLELDIHPSAYFVIDEFAKQKTLHKQGARAIVTGMPKYRKYSEIDIESRRRENRSRLNLVEKDTVAGFLGQPLWGIDGYRKTVSKMGEILSNDFDFDRLIYRPHPKEDKDDFDHLFREELFERDPFDSVEDLLLTLDLAMSCFSTCLYDFVMLNRYSRSGLGCSIYSLCEQEVIDIYKNVSNFDELPLVQDRIAFRIDRYNEAGEIVQEGLKQSSGSKLIKRIKTTNPDPQKSLELIKRHIIENNVSLK